MKRSDGIDVSALGFRFPNKARSPNSLRRMRGAIVAVLLVSACTAGGAPTTTSVPSADTTVTSPSTSVPGTSTTVAAPDHDRELAPDFTLALADGTTFTLSDAGRPVYLVFWAEWCPVCRKELPVVDGIAADYEDRVEFIAPVWRSVPESAETAAAELMPSGAIRWGLDNEEVIFELYGVPYQPVTVLIAADQTVFDQWAGVRKAEEIREALDEVLSVGESS